MCIDMRHKLFVLKYIFSVLCVFLCSLGLAEGLEDFVIADEEIMKEFSEEGIEADLIYLHKDWVDRDTAPIISVILFTKKEEVGDFKLLSDALSAGTENLRILAMDEVMRGFTPNARVLNYKLLSDYNALYIHSIYPSEDRGSVWAQYQVMAWSSRENARYKCVVASDIEERVESFYESTTTKAVIELLQACRLLWSDSKVIDLES